ncbi:MAG: M24 family metallopeptidase [Rhodothalassiaceae bacterium]
MRALIVCLAVLAATPGQAQETTDPAYPTILPLKQRAAVQDNWLRQRFDTVLPRLMRREGIDMWILIAREYNEDPVVETMLPATWMSARRRTILIFHDTGEAVERMAVARYPVSDLFPKAWDPESQPDQWARLRQIVQERDPERIGINISERYALASGLSLSQSDGLREALGDYAGRLVDAEALAIGWLETRTEAEMAVYPTIVRLAHAIIAEGFSERVITPGVTTAEDLVWWFRERVAELRLDAWFHPSVHIQRPETATFEIESMSLSQNDPILPGDFLHVDFGITYLGLNTDTQHHAYVLKFGETDAPEGLKAGLAAAIRVQDALIAAFKAGRTGNEVLKIARQSAIEQGLKPSIYSHPLGYHGHGAGPWIGAWDNQGGVPGGEFPVNANTAWSIELNARAPVPEWGGQEVRFMTEEDAYFDGESVRFLDGRQTKLHLIPRPFQVSEPPARAPVAAGGSQP